MKRILNKLRNLLFKKHNPYCKISYSQCGEDLIIDFILKDKGIDLPTYIDIGASHPYFLNNTAIFYERGSRGINIEPDPELFKAFVKYRKRDINLNIGVGEKQEERDFYIMSSRGLNTFSKEIAEKYEKEQNYKIIEVKRIKVDTLNNIIKKYFNNNFPDFLSIDCEGLEFEILKSYDFTFNFPKVICVETFNLSHGKIEEKIIDYLLNNNYRLHSSTFINSIFIKE